MCKILHNTPLNPQQACHLAMLPHRRASIKDLRGVARLKQVLMRSRVAALTSSLMELNCARTDAQRPALARSSGL